MKSGKLKPSARIVAIKLGAFIFLLLLVTIGVLVPSAIAETLSDFERCILEIQKNADDKMTLGEMRQKCRVQTGDEALDETPKKMETSPERRANALERRLATDDSSALRPYTLMAHRPNYFLFASHNFNGVNEEPYQEQFEDPTLEFDDTEAKFQISVKVPLAVNLFDKRLDIFTAYTNKSFWQLYNDQSAPFRETNHEPEIWLQTRHDWKVFGLTNRINQVGFVHQSNGRGGTLSRSWNRVFANFIFDHGNWVLGI
jgi:phospholipase A1